MIPYGRQDISETDIQAVVNVLRSDFITQGTVIREFERAVAEYCGAGFSVAVNSGTSALHLACLALGVGVGDRVWTSPITFVSSANCALYCGASVDFVDIDPRTYNIDVNCLAEKLRKVEQEGCLPKVVIPVHLCGQSCDMKEIHALSKRYGFKTIEDASHAIGGKYLGESIGCGRYSDVTVFSFHPVKIITTGEGGMALTNNHALASRMRRLHNHGITRNVDEMTQVPDGPWYYQQIELGFNYRMTDFQAALGLSQLRRLDEFVAKRHAIAKRYDESVSALPVIKPSQHNDCYAAYHLYIIRLKLEEISKTRREVFETLRTLGIGVNVHYIPVYHQPYYINFGFKKEHYAEAEQYYLEAISLPIYPTLTVEQQDQVIEALQRALDN